MQTILPTFKVHCNDPLLWSLEMVWVPRPMARPSVSTKTAANGVMLEIADMESGKERELLFGKMVRDTRANGETIE